jgi:hypothetical protein
MKQPAVRSSGGSWKTGSGPSPQESAPRKPWQSSAPAEVAPGKRSSGRAGFFFGLAVLLAGFAVLFYILTWLQPAKGTCLILVGAGYEENLSLPHNVYGRLGLEDLAQLMGGRGAWKLQQKTVPLVRIDDWDKGLSKVQERNIILYLALHGGADEKGAFLFPHNAGMPVDAGSLNAVEERLRLETVLQRLKEVPKNRHIVLILDATQVQSALYHGMAGNPFARELDKLNDTIAGIPNLVVLSASDVDQASWVSPELGRSVFAHFLIQGLQGKAAKAEPNRVSVAELHSYLSKQVETWVSANRQDRQTPVLYPRGEEGMKRAREIKLAPLEATTPTPTSQTIPAELVQAWETGYAIAARSPHPASYQPALWRQYQAVLLRYEQVLLADPAAAGKLRGQLTTLEETLRQENPSPLALSRSTSLALQELAVPGGSAEQQADLKKAFDELWMAKEKDQEKAWKKIQEAFKDNPHARRFFVESLFEIVSNDPGQLARGAGLMRLVEGAQQPRPVEAHFLLMLEKDLPRQGEEGLVLPEGLSLSYLGNALKVQRLAETTALGQEKAAGEEAVYPSSEKLLPWIQAAVEEVDARRRLAQDHFFATDAASWEAGFKGLAEAEDQYQKIAARTTMVRKAYQIRDILWSQLPYFARWTALRAVHAEAGQKAKYRKLGQDVERVIRECHELEELLAAVTAQRFQEQTGPDAEQMEELERKTKRLALALEQMEGTFQDHVAKTGLEFSPRGWLAVDDLLQVPLWNPKVREQLVQNRHTIAVRLLQDAGSPAVSAPDTAERVKELAEWELRLALAFLGKKIFEENSKQGQATFEQVQFQLDTLHLKTNWWDILTLVAREVEYRQKQLPKQVNALGAQGGPLELASLLQTLLGDADAVRQIEAAGTLFVRENPARKLSLFQWETVLLWQCQRAYLDHWAGDQPGAAYYQAAGKAFLEDAGRVRKQFAGLQPFEERAKELESRLAEKVPFRVELVGAPGLAAPGKGTPARNVNTASTDLHITSESEFPLRFALETGGKKAVVPGYPVLWVDPGKDLSVLASPSGGTGSAVALPAVVRLDQAGTRKLVFANGAADKVFLETRLQSSWKAKEDELNAPQQRKTELQLLGLFRGHRLGLESPLKIHLHTLAEVVRVEHPLPLMANLAVQAAPEIHKQHGTSTGGIAIVLDASGSMRPPQGQQWGPTTKYVQATAALREVFRTIPRGTKVSLWVFGKAVGEQRTVKAAEESIDQILKPTTWDPDNKDQIEQVMKAIEYPSIVPWNETPLIRTIIMAAGDLNGIKGAKSLVVITDGIDNRITQDKQLNSEGKTVEEFLKSPDLHKWFDGIQLNIIGFRVTSKEQKTAVEHFEMVKGLNPPGRLVLIEDQTLLAKTIQGALFQRLRYWIDWADNRPIVGNFDRGLDIGISGLLQQWVPGGLPPGNYQLRTEIADVAKKGFALNQADLLMVDLAPKPGKGFGELEFQRVIFSKMERYPPARIAEQENWIAGVLQNRLFPGGNSQMLLTLEQKYNPEEKVLQHIKPRFVWAEMDVESKQAAPFQMRWFYQPGFPAPAWSLTTPRWPAQAIPGVAGVQGSTPEKPVVRVWWSPFEEWHGIKLERGHQFNTLGDLNNEIMKMDNQEYVLESVRVEKHQVETRAPDYGKEAERQESSCLVVRIHYPEGKPAMARIKLPGLGGQEHRFYTSANKYTGIFWPVTPRQANEVLREIEVLSLGQFKKQAEAENYFVEIKDLPAPRPGEVLLQVPVNLYKLAYRNLGVDSGAWDAAGKEPEANGAEFTGTPGGR